MIFPPWLHCLALFKTPDKSLKSFYRERFRYEEKKKYKIVDALLERRVYASLNHEWKKQPTVMHLVITAYIATHKKTYILVTTAHIHIDLKEKDFFFTDNKKLK